ncbi:ATP-dependent DNA helicase RecG [Virgibacillus chiguensis]|uniref:ATP-dependent DNA helicase RecG n=1 Tax=Virgibacillus chiguensis TaxID=411959 RepID=A0A1M5NBF1_9BACI|nr:ATP-dependent DNA helicase RecG [Virgibacillus chiguensis]SHG86782.1 ATP-dependent DNA helicase RecG [Virgibacillus chiguensis]
MLTDPVTHVKGVGEKMGEDFSHIGIFTVEDLFNYFPYRYDVFEIKPLSELVHDDKVTIEGRVVHDPSLTFYGKQKSRLTFTLEVEQIAVKAVMFNRSFAKKHIFKGEIITLVGKWDAHRLQITVNTYKKGPASQQDEMQPVYPARGELSSGKLKKVMKQALASYSDAIGEILPTTFLTAYKLPTRKEAYQTLHMPTSRIALKHARRRLIYEEFLVFQLQMQLLRKWKREATVGNAQDYNRKLVKEFIDTFPFTLTSAQQGALEQILTDMQSPYRMNRLLQGDVGSGKTAVAAICLYASVTAGKQGALMVPTEILAEQHYESLDKLFGGRANIALLTGSIKGKKRKELVEQIYSQQIDIVIGTHALIQEDVQFSELGFVIVDEQHRFGVEQRRTLREKGLSPDVLFMTATPIPRTLAITAFGDMDVSIIDQMPLGRKEIETYWVRETMLDRVLQFVGSRIQTGEQAYVICPLIEESDKLDIQNAVDVYHQLRAYFPETVEIGLMHGRLTTEEKETIMKKFANNEVHLLVSTTVVEVGVNVPNATIMMIYDAERFGLSQLHQLRGRVGRGEKQSYCILIADPKGETGKERMRIMAETTDGFALSEQDLQLRGPGDFFGKKQSGLPEFKLADMIHDYRALETARQDAAKIIQDGLLETKEYALLSKYVENKFQVDEKLD